MLSGGTLTGEGDGEERVAMSDVGTYRYCSHEIKTTGAVGGKIFCNTIRKWFLTLYI